MQPSSWSWALLGSLFAGLLTLAAGLALGETTPAALAPGAVGALARFAPAGYAGSAACAGCHERQTKAWLASDHAHAMAEATPQTVLGDFNDVRVEENGSRARFFRDGSRFLVETEGRDGKLATFEVSDSFGRRPLQQYLVTFPDGRRQALPWAWDSRPKEQGGGRWFHLYPDRPMSASDPLHWTRSMQNWNFMCAECHSTALRKGFDAQKNSYATSFSEISVGCESCHGAGAAHVGWARQGAPASVKDKGFAATAPRRPAPDWSPDPGTGSPAHGVARPQGDEVETCARCHARRGVFSEDWRPGRPLTDTHLPAFMTGDLFEADGQMRDEVFNDHSFKQSLMYAKGVTCGDCHDPHSGALKASGSEVCGQCHQPARFATSAHSGHQPGPGAPDCVSCHMPARTYMVIDKRHDHSFRIPRPDLSDALGVSNTCADCHRDKPAAWAAGAIEGWHGPARKGFQTWGQAMRDAQAGDPSARDALMRLASDPATPAVARASLFNELQRFPSVASEELLRKALTDPDPMSRVAALRAQTAQPLDIRLRRAGPLLADPVAAVRLEAALLLADQPPAGLPEAERARLEAAFAEYEAAQRFNADRSEGRANLANFLLRRGQAGAAEAELRAGLKQEPTATPLHVNLADLYRTQGRETEAEQLLRQAIQLAPEAAAPRHALGLALIRQKRYSEGVEQLGRATAFAPEDARYAYVYVVALQSTGKPDQAREALAAALTRHGFDPDLLAAGLQDALKSGDAARAAPLAERLAALRPDQADLARLARKLNPK